MVATTLCAASTTLTLLLPVVTYAVRVTGFTATNRGATFSATVDAAFVAPSITLRLFPVELATHTSFVAWFTATSTGPVPTATDAVVLAAPSITVTLLLFLFAT